MTEKELYERHKVRARNRYRKKVGIPVDAEIWSLRKKNKVKKHRKDFRQLRLRFTS